MAGRLRRYKTYWRLIAWVAAAIAAYQATTKLAYADQPQLGVAYLVAATVLMLAATWRLPAPHDPSTDAPGSAPSRARRVRTLALPLALLVIALGVGAALRFYHLTSAPGGLWFDEAQNGIIADRLLHDSHYHPIFIADYVGTNRPSLPVYVFAGAIEVFGRTVFALRFVSALAGVLTVAALFWLGRELFNSRVGALAAFLLATMRWHLNFSRLAMEPIWGPFFVVMSAIFLVRAFKRGRWYDFAASGVFLGLALYFYWASLVLPVLYFLYAAHSLLTGKRLPVLRLVKGAAIVALAAFIVYSPVAVYAVGHPTQYRERSNEVAINKGKTLHQTLESLRRTTRAHALMFNVQGDGNPRHNLQDAPMLDAVTGAFFLLGIGLSLTRVRNSSHFFLLAWLVVLMLPGILSAEQEAPQALRSILATPAVALLAALPLAALWDIATPRAGARPGSVAGDALPVRGGRTYLAGGVAALGIAFVLAQVAYRNYDTYFHEQLNSPASWTAQDSDVTFVGREMKRLGPDYRYLLSPWYSSRPTLTFFEPRARSEAEYRVDLTGDLPLSMSRPTVVFLEGASQDGVYWIRSLYPDASVRLVGPLLEQPQTAVYEVIIPVQDIDRVRGIEATYQSGDSTVTRREPAIDFDWTAALPLAPPFQARWSGLIRVETASVQTIEMAAPGSLTVRLDGQVVASGTGSVAESVSLTPGYHRLEVEAAIDGPGRVLLSEAGQPLASDAYYAPLEPGQGLLASFYDSEDWTGAPSLVRVDPLVGFFYPSDIPARGLSSVSWTGKLLAPAHGSYVIEIQALGDAFVAIDGRRELSAGARSKTTVSLTAGYHDIAVLFSNPGVTGAQVRLYWTPPEGERGFISRQFLSPP